MEEEQIQQEDKKDETVHEDIESTSEVHPLQFSWSLWYSSSGKRLTFQSYEQSLKRVATFRTVEEFWGVFNHIPQPSQIAPKADFHIFKDGIEPKWEDPMNESGGVWQVSFRRDPSAGNEAPINDAWFHTVLAIVGDNFEPAESDDIRGIALAVRNKEYRLALWTGTAEDKELQEAIGRSFRKFATYSGTTIKESISFTSNKDALVDADAKPLYVV
ncbi:hypothetical protein GpartN1_g5114.t1 [Galdieria partita]|uniref:Eukaryotic translation initiation factor 4E n=1 Tax=Galdieria partita TaxID=83374 RepID=A0A9C7PYV7_9RHOD|nr:hypothetical protein GpartN1_g5114.t1 [Galdieria partita]